MPALTITAANVVGGTGATYKSGTAGASITAGKAVYVDTEDSNKIKLADGGASTAELAAGIASHAAATGQPITYQTSGLINLGATLVPGEAYVVGPAAAGDIAPVGDIAQGDYLTILGLAVSTTQLRISIVQAESPYNET